jgi:hypothetical protein
MLICQPNTIQAVFWWFVHILAGRLRCCTGPVGGETVTTGRSAAFRDASLILRVGRATQRNDEPPDNERIGEESGGSMPQIFQDGVRQVRLAA